MSVNNRIQIKKTVYVPLKTGEYLAEVLDIVSESGEYGEQLKFEFEIVGQDRTLHGWCSAKYGEKTKLYAWTRSILGRCPDNFDSSELLGRKCTLVIVTKAKEDGSVFNRIDGVLQAPVQSTTAPVAAVPATADVPF